MILVAFWKSTEFLKAVTWVDLNEVVYKKADHFVSGFYDIWIWKKII